MGGVSDRYGAAHPQPNLRGEVGGGCATTSEITKSAIHSDKYSLDQFSV